MASPSFRFILVSWRGLFLLNRINESENIGGKFNKFVVLSPLSKFQYHFGFNFYTAESFPRSRTPDDATSCATLSLKVKFVNIGKAEMFSYSNVCNSQFYLWNLYFSCYSFGSWARMLVVDSRSYPPHHPPLPSLEYFTVCLPPPLPK